MAEVDNTLIKRGFWIDWSQGPVLGSTLTTTPQAGNIIIAVLALTVTLATSHFWSLLLFLFYQYRARKPAGDGLYQQQQATLRSLPMPETFAVDIIKLQKSWFKQVPKGLAKSVIMTLSALGYFFAALTAGVFSSSVVSTSDLRLLINGQQCASMDIVKAWSIARTSATEKDGYSGQVVTISKQYVDRCYKNGTTPSECNIYVQHSIKSSLSMVPCPFQDQLCLGNGNMAVALDSGLIDSRTHLGINSQSKDRIQFRKRTSCAPLVHKGYSAFVDHSLLGNPDKILPGDKDFVLFYGTTKAVRTLPGATFASSVYAANITQFYTTHAVYWFARSEARIMTTCQVNTTLQRSDADTVLLGITKNSVAAVNPINDPIFAAHKPFPVRNLTFYSPDLPIDAIGCVEQYQICIEDGQNCSTMQSVSPNMFVDLPAGINDFQRAIAQLLTQAVWLSDVGTGFNLKDSGAFLKASERLEGGSLASLPDNQWMIEIQAAVDWAWSGIQRIVQDHATGFEGIQKAAMLYPQSTAERKFCQSQLVKKNGGFANISVFGLAFVVAISGSLVLISFIPMRLLVNSKYCRQPLFAQAFDRWNQDGILQLQRRVYQANNYGQWSKLDREIPITQAGDVLPHTSSFTPGQSQPKNKIVTTSTSPKIQSSLGTGNGTIPGNVAVQNASASSVSTALSVISTSQASSDASSVPQTITANINTNSKSDQQQQIQSS